MPNPLVIVTGGSKGIGFAISQILLSAGFSVHVLARNKVLLNKLVEELKHLGDVSYSIVDISNREEISKFSNNWDRDIYGIVNNAGVWKEERINENSFNVWDEIIKLNLEGVYFLTKSLQKFIIDGGRIVNISSQLGSSGREGFGAYCASKHGVIGLTRCWAIELSTRQITVNAVSPGWIKTESNIIEIKEWAEQENKSLGSKVNEIAKQTILKRFIEPIEVANLVLFLISDKGSGITGQVYEIK